MRYAIISDIHGNQEALAAVMAQCQTLRAQAIFCGGDVVGYGANPKEWLHFLQKNKITTVAGNHDWAVCGRLDYAHFTSDGKAAIEWERPQLGIDEITYLSGLPLTFKNNDFTLVHSGLNNPEEFNYLFDVSDAVNTFAIMEGSVCFVGHTHVPVIFVERQGKVYRVTNQEIEINEDCKYIVNVGSVGQPRDGNPMASFCIFDTAIKMVELHRVEYDISKAQQKIIQAGLPPTLAARLSRGQ